MTAGGDQVSDGVAAARAERSVPMAGATRSDDVGRDGVDGAATAAWTGRTDIDMVVNATIDRIAPPDRR
jgi:hypothetical protein